MLPRPRPRAAGAVGVALAVAACAAPAANAANRFTLDPHPATTAHLALRPDGSAIVAWTSESGIDQKAAVPMVCRIPLGGTCTAPQALEIPDGDATGNELAGLFPVVLPNGSAILVGPRFGKQDVTIWSSPDGATFGNGRTLGDQDHHYYPPLSAPEDVVRPATTS